jgi:hypothetical protein
MLEHVAEKGTRFSDEQHAQIFKFDQLICNQGFRLIAG